MRGQIRSEGKKLKERGGKRRGIRKKNVETKQFKKRRQQHSKSGNMRKIVKGEKKEGKGKEKEREISQWWE